MTTRLLFITGVNESLDIVRGSCLVDGVVITFKNRYGKVSKMEGVGGSIEGWESVIKDVYKDVDIISFKFRIK